MAWAKVDDKLHGSVKWRRASKGGRALWTTALSWCSDQENGGKVPVDMLRVLDGTNADASSLVRAGLWHETDEGWIFNDWADYNPDSASLKAKREAESKGGKLGNHTRWHVKAGINVPECEFCNPSGTRSGGESAPDRVETSGGNPPVPTRPDPTQTTLLPAADAPDEKPLREDVNRICEHLADRIAENGVKRPTIGKGWRDAARLMLDRDGYTEPDIARVIDWATTDPFWRSNILSMPKLREKYGQLLLKANQPAQGNVRPFARTNNDWMAGT